MMSVDETLMCSFQVIDLNKKISHTGLKKDLSCPWISITYLKKAPQHLLQGGTFSGQALIENSNNFF